MRVVVEARAETLTPRRETVEDVYRAHGPHAFRLAYLLVGDDRLAEDVVQDAFMRLLGRLRSIRDPAALRGYLNRSVVNLAKNERRAAARLRERLARTPVESSIASIPDVGERDEVHRRLMGLPYRQRAALVLRYCEDMSEHEVAETLGTSPKAVRSLVGRGLATLRQDTGGDRDD